MVTALLFILITLRSTLTNCNAPPKYGPFTCRAPTEITIKGLQTGGSDTAYLIYPEEANETTHFPFLVFAHGDTAGGNKTYSNYWPLWHSVCSYGY